MRRSETENVNKDEPVPPRGLRLASGDNTEVTDNDRSDAERGSRYGDLADEAINSVPS